MQVNIFLIVVLAIIAVCTIIGYARGFIKTVFSMAAMLIMLILTVILSPYVKTYIRENTKLPEKVYSGVEEKFNLSEKFEVDATGKMTDYVDTLGLPDKLNEVILEKAKESGEAVDEGLSLARDEAVSSIYKQITDIVLSAIAYVFTFAVVGVIMVVAGLLLNIMEKLPVIKQMNKLLGLLIGFLQGYLVISLLYVIATALGATGFGSGILEMVGESSVLSFIYDHNFIVNFVMTVF